MFIINPYFFGAPPWTPLDIADCMLWLDADDPATITMGAAPKVAGWLDKSVSALSFEQATSGNQPDLNTTIYTRPCIDFEPMSSGIFKLISVGTVAIPADHTVFMAMNFNRRTEIAGYGAIGLQRGDTTDALSAGTAAHWMIVRSGAGTSGGWQASMQPSGGDYAYEAARGTYAADSKTVSTFTIAGTLASAALDVGGVSKTLTTAGGPTWTPPSGTLLVGGSDTLYQQPKGSIAEIIMYSRVLTAPEIATVQAYLNAKWV